MMKTTSTNPTLTARTHTVSEVHMELDQNELRRALGDAEFLIIRIPTSGPSGRPSSKTIRLHRGQLQDPKADEVWLD